MRPVEGREHRRHRRPQRKRHRHHSRQEPVPPAGRPGGAQAQARLLELVRRDAQNPRSVRSLDGGTLSNLRQHQRPRLR